MCPDSKEGGAKARITPKPKETQERCVVPEAAAAAAACGNVVASRTVVGGPRGPRAPLLTEVVSRSGTERLYEIHYLS